jgi:hypothetical protein
MSRMTAAQIITLGEYLEPDFDPATLTVNQLPGASLVFTISSILPLTPNQS